jgi:TonB family protein
VEPVTPEPPKTLKPAEPDLTQPPTGRRRPIVNTQLTERKTNPRNRTAASNANSDSDADERAAAKAATDARRRVVAGALANIGNLASSSTSVEIPGPGGEAFASYKQVVKSIYTQAWIEPRDVEDDSATVQVSVTILRNGTVADARITKPSGNTAVDASIRRLLESVTFVAPFPVGSKDEKRPFTINFNLKAKRQLG